MTDNGDKKGNTQSQLDDLDARIRDAKVHAKAPRGLKTRNPLPSAGWSLGIKLATDFVSGVIVGGGIGFVLDNYVFDTKPWLMIVFFFLGSAAGFLNVYRRVNGMGYAVGYQKPDPQGSENQTPGSEDKP